MRGDISLYARDQLANYVIVRKYGGSYVSTEWGMTSKRQYQKNTDRDSCSGLR